MTYSVLKVPLNPNQPTNLLLFKLCGQEVAYMIMFYYYVGVFQLHNR